MTDKYDDAIAYLTENPSRILGAWNDPVVTGGCLFAYVNPLKIQSTIRGDGRNCGCLTQIRSRSKTYGVSYWPSITHAIRNDTRIPMSASDITVKDLPMFAEWQRNIDILCLKEESE